MHSKVALLLAVTAIFAAACNRETKKNEVVTTTTNAARGTGETTTPATQSSTATSPQPASGVEVGDAMPAYTAPLLDGSELDIAKQKGSVVLLNLWATWCGPCRYEIPELEKMHNAHAKDGFKVVGVSLDEGGVDGVKEFVTKHEMTYPIALDPESHLTTLFRTSVIPTTVLIDRGGKIVWKKYGMIEAGDKTLEAALQKALAAKS
ncbi:MAG TPA: TlpA disulfide reductase family protein [Thermoanaerobaculia bacterium]|nr:TlpA disulfide reductase family protein [Thermoanaerobaculia bacterium]